VVEQRLGQRLHPPVHAHRFVHGIIHEAAGLTPEEPELVVRIEAAVADPPPQNMLRRGSE
jgi:hypothetical protein